MLHIKLYHLLKSDDQFEQYYEDETAVNRTDRTKDTRVHVCLYFIAPTGKMRPSNHIKDAKVHVSQYFIAQTGNAIVQSLFDMSARTSLHQQIRKPYIPYEGHHGSCLPACTLLQ